MKITLNEYDSGFNIELEPETMTEAATLVRLGMCRTNELRHCDASVHKDGTFAGFICIGKKQQPISVIRRA